MPFTASVVFKGIDGLTPAFKAMQVSTGKFANGFTTAVGGMSSRFQDFSDRSLKSLDNMQKKSSRTADIMKGMIGADLIQQGISGLINFAKEGIKLSSDLIEVQNVVDTTFRNNSQAVNDWAKQAAVSFGVSELQAKQFTGSLGAMMKSSGVSSTELVKMSTSLSGLAGDFASFYNLDVADAFDKIRAGISGETEPLKKLGINMSVANLEAFALQQGVSKSWAKMSQAEQVQLRYAYLMKVSTDAQGDFAKTLETSAANQGRVLEMQKQAFSANLMKTLLPRQLEMYKQLNQALVWMNNNTATLAVLLKTLGIVLGILAAKYVLVKVAVFALKTAQIALGIVQFIMYKLTGNLTEGFLKNATAMKLETIWVRISMAAKKGWTVITKIASIATRGFAASMAALNAVNPVFWIILAIAAIVLLIIHWDKVKKAFNENPFVRMLVFVSPLAMIIDLIGFIQDRWGGLKKAFSGGFGEGLMAVGRMLLSFVLKPLETILMVIAKITGSDMAKDALNSITEFRKGLDVGLIDQSKVVNKDATLTEKQISEKKTTQNVQIDINDKGGNTKVWGGLQPIPINVNSTRQF
jgi:hypothetical protein